MACLAPPPHRFLAGAQGGGPARARRRQFELVRPERALERAPVALWTMAGINCRRRSSPAVAQQENRFVPVHVLLPKVPGKRKSSFVRRAMRLDLARPPTLSSVATRWPSCRALRMEENGVDADFPWRFGMCRQGPPLTRTAGGLALIILPSLAGGRWPAVVPPGVRAGPGSQLAPGGRVCRRPARVDGWWRRGVGV